MASDISAASLPLANAEDATVGASAQRKAALRLLPILGIGYGLAYIDRINISFASLRMNSDLHFSATVYGLGSGTVLYRLCAMRSAVEPDDASLWRAALAGAHHAHMGNSGHLP